MSTTEPRRLRRTFAIVNRKGGVGKSATAANLGAALALRGWRVLLIDTDAQRNLTTHMGVPDRRDSTAALTINDAYRAPKVTLEAIGPTVEPGVDLMYGSRYLEDTEKELLTMQHVSAGLIMARIVGRATAANEYDYVLIDCPPAEGLLTRNALVAADGILMPVATDYSGFEGMGRLKELIGKLAAQDAFDGPIPPLYAYPYFVEEASTTSTEMRDYMFDDDFKRDNAASDVPTFALRAQIHRNRAISDSYGVNQSVFRYIPVDTKGKKRGSADNVKRAREEFTILATEVENV